MATDHAEDYRADGALDMASWLVATLHVSQATARAWVRVGTALAGLPHLRGCFAAAELSFDQIAAVTRFATPATDEVLAHEVLGCTAAELDDMARERRKRTRRDAQNSHHDRRFGWRQDHDLDGYRYTRPPIPSARRLAWRAVTPEEVLVLYGRAWFERDRDQRIEVLRSACSEDIRFMDPQLGVLHGLEAVADMIGSYMDSPMQEHEGEAREEHERGMSGSGVSVEVVTPIESFHGFYRYSYIWHFPDRSSSGGTSFCEQAPDGRIRLITVWGGSDHFPIPPSRRT